MYTRGWRQQVYIASWRLGISPRFSSSEENMYFTKKFHSHLTLFLKKYVVWAQNTAVLRHKFLHHPNYFFGLIPAFYVVSLNQFDHTLRPIYALSCKASPIKVQYLTWARICKSVRSPGIDSARLCSLACRYVKQGCRTGPPGWESIPGLHNMFTIGLWPHIAASPSFTP